MYSVTAKICLLQNINGLLRDIYDTIIWLLDERANN
jgi:hypothetical protein